MTNEWQSSLCQIFAFLSRHAFAQHIIFRDYYDPKVAKHFDNPVVVLDAVNPDNNVAHKWDESIKRGYLKCIQHTHMLIQQAQSYERNGDEESALDIWCQIFGEEFRRLSQ